MNTAQFGQFYASHHSRLVHGLMSLAGNREKAEEATSEAFRIAWERRESFRQESSFYTWVYAIARNEVLSMHRAKPCVSLDGPDCPVLSAQDNSEQNLDRSLCRKRVRAALKRIPAIYRRLLTQRFLRDRSIRQLARLYSIPEGTVASRLYEARRCLRERCEM